MNPPCAFCKKTVYPTEKFNCLDKIWHKGCFKCTDCSLKLTMNTYKGYNKLPYCKAHYPHLKATQVAQTVEGARLSSLTKQQSQVEYHKAHNQTKGAKMSVADDPETMRQKKVSNQQSNAVYQNRAAQKAEEERNRPEVQDQPVQGYGVSAYRAPDRAPEPEPEPQMQAPPSDLKQFKALYDYEAADSDEVSFREDDIFQGSIVDEGWLEGTVVSSGQYGMVPRNYFEEL